jgi:hypothetical protein
MAWIKPMKNVAGRGGQAVCVGGAGKSDQPPLR